MQGVGDMMTEAAYRQQKMYDDLEAANKRIAELEHKVTRLLGSELRLRALENAGVASWDGYSDAMLKCEEASDATSE